MIKLSNLQGNIWKNNSTCIINYSTRHLKMKYKNKLRMKIAFRINQK